MLRAKQTTCCVVSNRVSDIITFRKLLISCSTRNVLQLLLQLFFHNGSLLLLGVIHRVILAFLVQTDGHVLVLGRVLLLFLFDSDHVLREHRSSILRLNLLTDLKLTEVVGILEVLPSYVTEQRFDTSRSIWMFTIRRINGLIDQADFTLSHIILMIIVLVFLCFIDQDRVFL